jgi:enoyl-CoA hydratase/carnithine racemase
MSYDTGTEDLLASVSEGVLTLTLNRPAARNALSRAMLDGRHRHHRGWRGVLRRRRRERHGGAQ